MKKKIKNVKQIGMSEPSWIAIDEAHPNYRLNLIHGLNYLNYMFDSARFKKETLDYLKKAKQNIFTKEQIEALTSAPDNSFNAIGKGIMIFVNGGRLSKKHRDSVWDRVEHLMLRHKKAVTSKVTSKNVVTSKPKPNPQLFIREKSYEYLSEIELWIDNKDYKQSVYDWMQSNSIKPIYSKFIVSFYSPIIKELAIVVKGTDDEVLQQSYPNKKENKTLHKFLTKIVDEAKLFANNQKSLRKPRKKKEQPKSKLVAKLNYKQADKEFKLVSVAPEKIIGATQIWVFNTKNRRLGVYNANDRAGLSVKGSTLLDFNDKTSIQKTIRKPEKVLARVASGGKIVLRKIMGEIKAKEKVLTGRLNCDTIILKII